jgi:hypothetical protein
MEANMFRKSLAGFGSFEKSNAAVYISPAAAIISAAVFLGPGPARADSVEVYISDTDNRTVTVTATDLNDSKKALVTNKTLKHNERWSGKMLLDKDNNGHVQFEAKAVDDKTCETRTYEGKQLSKGFDWQVSLKCGPK